MMRFRISPSRILRGLQRRDIGLLQDGSVWDLDGFRIGIILPSFQMLGMLLCWMLCCLYNRMLLEVRFTSLSGSFGECVLFL